MTDNHHTAPDSTSIWVVLPTYNGSAHLRQQLRSIAEQDRLPDGVVASDDCSTDDSVAILEEFAHSVDFPVTVLRQPHNLGLLGNLEVALEEALAHADVIAFADQDDVWHPDKLTSISQAFASPDVLLWFSDAELVDASGNPHGTRLWDAVALTPKIDVNHPDQLLRFITGLTIFGTAMAARSALIRAALPFPRTTTQERHLFLHDGWLGLIAHLRRGVFLEPRPLTDYRQHEQQFTGMSVLRGAQTEHAERRISLGIDELLDENHRVQAIADHLRRPHTLAFLGGSLPVGVSDRLAYISTRVEVVSGHASPLRLRHLRGDYVVHANGVRTLAVDVLRHMRSRIRPNPMR